MAPPLRQLSYPVWGSGRGWWVPVRATHTEHIGSTRLTEITESEWAGKPVKSCLCVCVWQEKSQGLKGSPNQVRNVKGDPELDTGIATWVSGALGESVLHGGVKWERTGGSGGDRFPRMEGETDVKTRSLGSVQSEVTLAASARRLCSILYGFHPSYGADGHS